MPKLVAFATDAAHPDLTTEDRLVVAHLADHGVRVTAARWDDPDVDWRAFDAIVIRSCWDYHLRTGDFDAWLDRLEAAGLDTLNPIATLRWNSRKTYLRDLQAAGFDVVPTRFLARGSRARLGEVMESLRCDELVLKPTVGASAFGLWTASRESAPKLQPRLDAALAEGELMAQPRLGEVETSGEWSLVYFAGGFSHAVHKRPAPGDLRVQEELGGRSEPARPPAPLRSAADRLVAWLPGAPGPGAAEAPLYARVDLVEVDGRAVLMELELIEPWLFFHAEPRSPGRFRRALLARLAPRR